MKLLQIINRQIGKVLREKLLGVPNFRLINNITISVDKQKADLKLDGALPFDKIPGPKPLPLIGNVFRYLPYIGEYHDVPFLTQLQLLKEQYGDIVRLEGIPMRKPTIFLFNPEYCERMFRLEGPQPRRVSMEVLHHHRIRNKHLFPKPGLATSQGQEWYEFRSQVNQSMMQPRTIKPHVSQIDDVTKEFINRIRELRDPKSLELPASFNNELNKWSLESICAIALDHRIGSLKSNLDPESEPQRMINAVHDMFDLMYKLEILPSFHKYYITKDLKKFFNVLDFLYGTSAKYITRAKTRLDKDPNTQEESMLKRLLKIDEMTARVMAMDMFVAGIDTTGNVAGMALYHIAKHPQVQKKLRTEIDSILAEKDSPITYEDLNKIPYLRACIKEVLRLNPVATGNMRTMVKDVTIAGYRIPEGVNIIAAHAIISQDQSQFPEPKKFIPERWLRDETSPFSAAKAHSFAYMPFGFGPRTCIGKRFAELEITILIMRIIRNFGMEWHHEPMNTRSLFINTMGSPLQIKIIDR